MRDFRSKPSAFHWPRHCVPGFGCGKRGIVRSPFRRPVNQKGLFKTNETSTPSVSKQPSHIAYHLCEREGEKAVWTRVGFAWAHGDGKGFSVQLDAAPVDGRLSLRVFEAEK